MEYKRYTAVFTSFQRAILAIIRRHTATTIKKIHNNKTKKAHNNSKKAHNNNKNNRRHTTTIRMHTTTTRTIEGTQQQ